MMETHMAGRYAVIPLLTDAHIHRGTPVIVRADFDVAFLRGRIADSSRIKAVVPTLRALERLGARIRIVAHLGRPRGARDPKLSLAPVGRMLAGILHRRIVFVKDPFTPEALKKYEAAADMLLFENIRFWPGEEKNDRVFAMSLARWGEVYVNEAFAACHRGHASIEALAEILPAYAGLCLESEIKSLGRLMENQKHPFVAVLGGAKIETKLSLIRRFMRDADEVLVGGALANTLLALQGHDVGRSVAEAGARVPRSLLNAKKLHLPPDLLVAPRLADGAQCRVCSPDGVRSREYIVDIGPEAQKEFATSLLRAKTSVWNGPMGFAEVAKFSRGTIAVADAMKKSKGFTVAGGGDTVAALARYGMGKQFSHVSMGGGAMLTFLAGERLPGLEVLRS